MPNWIIKIIINISLSIIDSDVNLTVVILLIKMTKKTFAQGLCCPSWMVTSTCKSPAQGPREELTHLRLHPLPDHDDDNDDYDGDDDGNEDDEAQYPRDTDYNDNIQAKK